MDVGPVSGRPVGTGVTQGPGITAPVAKPSPVVPVSASQATAVIDAAILSLLSKPDLARLVTVLEPAQTAQGAIRSSEILQAAIDAAARGDAVRALESVGQLAALDPQRADSLRTDSRVDSIRTQVESLLTRLGNIAKLDAESRLTQATRVVEGGQARLSEWDARPEALISIANQLLDAGGHVNFVRAAQVAQIVIDAAHWAPAPVAEPLPESPTRGADGVRGPSAADRPIWSGSFALLRKQVPARVARLWRRAPLLVLLLGWFAVGIAGGLASWLQRAISPDAVPDGLTDAGFSAWALGLVALVLFGFYMRVRNVRL